MRTRKIYFTYHVRFCLGLGYKSYDTFVYVFDYESITVAVNKSINRMNEGLKTTDTNIYAYNFNTKKNKDAKIHL